MNIPLLQSSLRLIHLPIILIFVITLAADITLAASNNKNLVISFTRLTKSKITLNNTELTVSADPASNIDMLSDSSNITTKIRTGGPSAATLEAATALVKSSGAAIPVAKTVLAGISGAGGEASWREVEGNFFHSDLWDVLVLHTEFNDCPEGPAAVQLTYTLSSP